MRKCFLTSIATQKSYINHCRTHRVRKCQAPLPEWLEMADLAKKTQEEEYLDEFVILAGLAIKKDSFLPLPPKTPKTPVESEKNSDIPIEEICIEQEDPVKADSD